MCKDVVKLLEEMSLNEKCAQLLCYQPSRLMNSECRFDESKAKNLIPYGVGFIGNIFIEKNKVSKEQAIKFFSDLNDWIDENVKKPIYPLIHAECLSGLVCEEAVSFPIPINVAATFDAKNAAKISACIKNEILSLGIRQVLSPVLDLAWDARWGRYEETYGEDPLIVSDFAVSYVSELQGADNKDACVTLKHFGAHGICEGGRNAAPVRVGRRELADFHFLPFEACIKVAKAQALMNAYNSLDGVPCVMSKELLTAKLKKEWLFDGITVSDYGAVGRLVDNHYVSESSVDACEKSFNAGMDLEFPNSDCYVNMQKNISDKKININDVNQTVEKILILKSRLGLFNKSKFNLSQFYNGRDNHLDNSRKIAQQSIVLLKNNNTLPLKQPTKIAVLGPMANNPRGFFGDYTIGMFRTLLEKTCNNNSSFSDEDYLKEFKAEIISLKDSLINIFGNNNVFSDNCCEIMDEKLSDVNSSLKNAKNADCIILALGNKSALEYSSLGNCGEGLDRTDLRLAKAQCELIKQVKNLKRPTILVLFSGKPVVIENENDFDAVLMAFLPGQFAADAITNIISGKYNPSGKLPITWPRSVGQIPIRYNINKDSINEKISHYCDVESTPLYCFGHGLSFTEFKYSDIIVSCNALSKELSVELCIQNIGKFDGHETVQIYINDKITSVTRPKKELKAYKRIFIRVEQKKKLKFMIPYQMLAYTDINYELGFEDGEFELLIGSSSEDIRISNTVYIKGNKFESRSIFSFSAEEL